MFKTLWDDAPHVHMTTQMPEDSNYEAAADRLLIAKDKWDERKWFWHDVNRHWNYEGGDAVVEVYTNRESVELFSNGESLGAQRLADNPDRILKWLVLFVAGKLEALGDCKASDRLETTGKPAQLSLSTDRNTLAASGLGMGHTRTP